MYEESVCAVPFHLFLLSHYDRFCFACLLTPRPLVAQFFSPVDSFRHGLDSISLFPVLWTKQDRMEEMMTQNLLLVLQST